MAMGAWGTAIFSNDTSQDVRTEFRDLVSEGLSPTEASDKLTVSFGVSSDPLDDPDFWLGLALAQHALGRRTDDVVDKAFQVLDHPERDLERWEASDRAKRRRALDKARQTLIDSPPHPKPLRKHSRGATTLARYDHVLVRLADGHRVLLRVLGFHTDSGGTYPTVSALAWDDTTPVPDRRRLLRLKPHRDPVPDDGFDSHYLGFMVGGGSRGEPRQVEVLPSAAPSLWRRLRWLLQFPRTSSWVVTWKGLERWFKDGQPVDPTAGTPS